MRKQILLFLIIFVEGYIVLATELLAIRSLMPFVGSGIEVVSIIIGAVLLPLAIGYWAGGRRAGWALEKARAQGKYSISIRRILQRNLMIALIILAVGLPYVMLRLFFIFLEDHGITHRIPQTAIYVLVFLVYPTYLLAQTVPLVSNYFSRARLSEITGRMLFFSTAGSFLGSIVSTLVLMTVIGVHNTVTVTIILIAVLIGMVSPPKRRVHMNVLAGMIAFGAWVINSDEMMDNLGMVADTPYSMISLIELPDDEAAILSINHSWSSKFSHDPEKRFPYIKYIDKHFITSLKDKGKRNILVLGAGGFVVGWDDKVNDYTFVDIESALKSVSEKHFLPEPLSANKRFVSTSARAFLRRTKERYDLVVVDVYSNVISMPMEAITKEFLQDIKKVLNPDAIVVANIISSPTYDDAFSVRYYNTFASVFPVFDRHVMADFSAWGKQSYANTLYIYYNKQQANEDRSVYTDDKNTYSFDH